MNIDKGCIKQVLGSLIKHPQYLSEIDKYSFVLTDFPSRFEKYIFSAINGLYRNGAPRIQIVDIENFLSSDEIAKKTFEQENGIEYLLDVIEQAEIENFPYYYNRLKKLNLLKDLQRNGFDIGEFYEEDITNPKYQEINRRFESLTLKEITNHIRSKVLNLENKYEVNDEIEVESAAARIDSFVEELEELQEIGLPVQGRFYNQIIDGARPGTLTIRSAS